MYEPPLWEDMITMIVGGVANFATYDFSPTILVTPLGALIIIFNIVLALINLREELHIFGILGCVPCVLRSTTIVLHGMDIECVKEVWNLAIDPTFFLHTPCDSIGSSSYSPLYATLWKYTCFSLHQHC